MLCWDHGELVSCGWIGYVCLMRAMLQCRRRRDRGSSFGEYCSAYYLLQAEYPYRVGTTASH